MDVAPHVQRPPNPNPNPNPDSNPNPNPNQVEEPPHSTPPLFRDETLEQFRAAAAAYGLRVDRLGASGPTADALVWPAESFTAFSPHTTSEVFLVQVTLGPPA